MAKADYYAILGVKKNATKTEITKAFRKLARENHPDRGGSTEKFQQINEAYSTLKDPKKRRNYDLYGDGNDSNMTGEDFGTMFARSFFGNMMGGSSNSSSRRRSGRRSKKRTPSGFTKVTNLEYKLSVSLEELYKGVEKSFRIKRKRVKYPEGISRENCFDTCEECEGYGQINTVKRLGNMIQRFTGPCGKCRGNGYLAKPGIKIIEEVERVNVNIEAGMEKGDRIILENVGDELVGYLPGDLLFIIDSKRHDLFLRKSNDLMMKLRISLQDALCGINVDNNKSDGGGSPKISIQHLDMHKVFIKSYDFDVITPGSVRCIYEEGMPSRYGDPGNLFIVFEVDFPDKLSPKQIVGLRKAFNEEEDDADSDDEEEDENATGGNFLSSFFGSNRRSSQSKISKKNVNNNRDDDDHHQSNDIDQAWLDGRENNGMYYIKYLDLATIDDFGRNLIKPDNGNENNQRNSRL